MNTNVGNRGENHGVETRSLPNSLAATLAALPSISLIPSARLHGYHGLGSAQHIHTIAKFIEDCNLPNVLGFPWTAEVAEEDHPQIARI
jgi:hypothetical protein